MWVHGARPLSILRGFRVRRGGGPSPLIQDLENPNSVRLNLRQACLRPFHNLFTHHPRCLLLASNHQKGAWTTILVSISGGGLSTATVVAEHKNARLKSRERFPQGMESRPREVSHGLTAWIRLALITTKIFQMERALANLTRI